MADAAGDRSLESSPAPPAPADAVKRTFTIGPARPVAGHAPVSFPLLVDQVYGQGYRTKRSERNAANVGFLSPADGATRRLFDRRDFLILDIETIHGERQVGGRGVRLPRGSTRHERRRPAVGT